MENNKAKIREIALKYLDVLRNHLKKITDDYYASLIGLSQIDQYKRAKRYCDNCEKLIKKLSDQGWSEIEKICASSKQTNQ